MGKEEKRLQRKAKLAHLARRTGVVAVTVLPMAVPAFAGVGEDMAKAVEDGFKELLANASLVAAAVGILGISVVLIQYGPIIGINLARKIAGAATK